MILNILILIISYLLGSVSSGLFIGKIFYKTDIREHGSHNTGTTNAWRVLGPKAGIATFLFDFLKGAIAYSLAVWLNLDWNPFIFGLAAILGHTYPIFTGFKGGKAVATSGGVAFAYNPLFLFFNFPIVFGIVLYLTSMVSVASMTAVVSAFIISLFLKDWILIVMTGFMLIFIFYRHKDNIKRIKNGTESMIPWGLGYQRRKNKE